LDISFYIPRSAKPWVSAVISDMRALKTAIVDLRGW